MNGRELVYALRESRLDDLKPPYLWSETELLRFLNYAEVQACRRAHLLIDWTTANDSGTAGTAGTLGQKPLCVLTVAANTATYHLSPKVLQIKRCQLRSMTYPLTGPVSYPLLDEYQSGWWGTSGTVGLSGQDGTKATGSLTSLLADVAAGDTVTIDTKVYTFRAALSLEGEVLIGADVFETLDHLKKAINHTGVPNTDYKCAVQHPTVSATTLTNTATQSALTIEARTAGVIGNLIALERTGTALTPSGVVLSGGVDNSGYPTYFINEPVNTITFVPAPPSIDTAYLVISRIPLLPFTLQTSPEVEEKYHEGLMDWAAHLAFMKPDAETINLNLAQIYEQKFTQQFGTLPDAYSEKMRKTLSQRERMRSREFGS